MLGSHRDTCSLPCLASSQLQASLDKEVQIEIREVKENFGLSRQFGRVDEAIMKAFLFRYSATFIAKDEQQQNNLQLRKRCQERYHKPHQRATFPRSENLQDECNFYLSDYSSLTSRSFSSNCSLLISCDIAIVAIISAKVCVDDVFDSIRLQRLFRSNYFIFAKYLSQVDIEKNFRHCSSSFIDLPICIQLQEEAGSSLSFDEIILVEEQISLSDNDSKSVIEAMKDLFGVKQQILYGQIAEDLEVFCGIRLDDSKSSTPSQDEIIMYFFEEGEIILREEVQEGAKEVFDRVTQEINQLIDSTTKRTKTLSTKIITESVGLRRLLPRRKDTKSSCRFVFILNGASLLSISQLCEEEDEEEGQRATTELLARAVNYRNKVVELADVQFISDTQIPAVTKLIQDLCELIEEPLLDPHVNQLQQSLTKVFLFGAL